jgi:hypothetical protein
MNGTPLYIGEETVKAKYEELFEIYKNTSRKAEFARIEEHIYAKRWLEAQCLLDTFLDEEELMIVLENKLKGKPIYKTLKKIREGKIESREQILKGLFSLGTHAIIECEKGAVEYMAIVKKIHSKLSDQLKTA